MNLLIPAMSRLSIALKDYLLEDRFRAMDIQFVMQQVPAFEGSAQDLGIFFSYLDLLLLEEANAKGEISSAARKLQMEITLAKAALNRSVLAYAYGSSYGIDEKTLRVSFVPRALSIWLPSSPEEYFLRRAEFTSSRFYRDSNWNSWLDTLYLPN